MKKALIVLLTVLMMLMAIIIVQAQEITEDPAPMVTEGEAGEVVPVDDPEEEEQETVEEIKEPVDDGAEDESLELDEEELEEIDEDDPVKETDDEIEDETPEIEDVTETPEADDGEITETPEITEETPASEETPAAEGTPAAEVTPVTEETSEPVIEETPEVPVIQEVVVSIRGAQVTAAYDGGVHKANGYTVTSISNDQYTAGDFVFVGNASAELTDAGFMMMNLSEEMFINRNDRFIVTFEIEDGYVEVSPINLEIQIIGNVESADYDGNVHTAEGYSFSQKFPEEPQLVSADSFEFLGDAYVERTEVGVSPMGLSGSSFRNINPNFNRVIFSVMDGYVEVLPSEAMYEEEALYEEEYVEEEIDETPIVESTAEEITETPEAAQTEEEVTGTPEEGQTEEEVTETPEADQTEGEVTETPEEGQTEEEVTETPEADQTEEEVTETPEEGQTEEEVTETPEADQTGEEVTETPEADQTEGEVTETPEADQTEENTAGMVTFAAGTVVYAAPDTEADVIMTLEDEMSFAVKSGAPEGWIEVMLDETGSGFVAAAGEEPEDESAVEETAEPTVEPVVEMITLDAGTVIYADADTESEVVMTLEEAKSFTVKSRDPEGWIEVVLNETGSGFVTNAAEETAEPTVEPVVEMITLDAGTVIYTAADTESEVVMTLEEAKSFTVKSRDPEGWIEVMLDETASGFVAEAVEETAEPTAEVITLDAGTVIYAAADIESEVLMTLEETKSFAVKSSDLEGWIEVMLDETESGFVEKTKEESENAEDQILVPAGTNLRADADGMSEIIYTFEEEAAVTILDEVEDWLYVTTADDISGYLFKADVSFENESDGERKVTIFTSRRSVMQVGEDIILTSVLEGFDDVVVSYQWQCDKGSGFEAVEGANDPSYTYQASVESLSWSWRLMVSIAAQPE